MDLGLDLDFKKWDSVRFLLAPLWNVKGVIIKRTFRLRRGYVVLLDNGMEVHNVYPEQIKKVKRGY